MSEWYHQLVFEDGSVENLSDLNIYPNRDYALSSADNFCIGGQAAFDKHTPGVEKRIAKIRVLRVGDNWCYAESDGKTMKIYPDGPGFKSPA